MARKFIENIEIENANLLGGSFKNFSGRAGKYNPPGRRSFCVIIPEASVQTLMDEGWNIKTLNPRDEEDEPKHYLQVRVNYGEISPNIYICTKRNKTLLTEDTISELDFVEMGNVDLIIRPYIWDRDGESGVTAYVKAMYVTVIEDSFASKYAYDNVRDDGEIPFN